MNEPVLLIPIVGMSLPLILVPVALGVRYARHQRTLEHTERIKALEMGRTLPQDEPWCTPARIALSIGAGVPIGVFLIAWLASTAIGWHEEMWVATGLVGMSAVISGTVLAAKHFTLRAQSEMNAAARYAAGKPPIDEDAYDVVSSRG
jgi:hypothetical protein